MPDPMAPTMPGMPPAQVPVQIVRSVPVLPTDDPTKHVPEHMATLARAIETGNEAVKAAVLAHVAEHLHVWRSSDPAMLALLKIPTPSQMGVAGAGMGGGSEPSGPPKGELPEANPQEQDSTGVDLPQPAESPIAAE